MARARATTSDILSSSKPVSVEIDGIRYIDTPVNKVVATVTVTYSDGITDTREMDESEITRKYRSLLTGEQVSHLQALKVLEKRAQERPLRQQSAQNEQAKKAIKVSFGDFDYDRAVPSVDITITYEDGTTVSKEMNALSIKNQFLFVLTLKQANQLSEALDKNAATPLLEKIGELDVECLGIKLEERKSVSFFSSQMTMKEYLLKMAVSDPGKALKIVDIFEKAKNGSDVAAGMSALQSELGKHRGFIRQFLQSIFGGSWGNTTGVTLLNELRKP